MKAVILITTFLIALTSCNISSNKPPTVEKIDTNRKVGYEGRVVEFRSNKRIVGGVVKFWGESIKDTLFTITDTAGCFKLAHKYKFATGTFHLQIIDKKFGIIVNRTNTLYNGCIDNTLYFAYPQSWVKIFLRTKSDLKKTDVVGYYFEGLAYPKKNYYYIYGANRARIDTIIRFKRSLMWRDSYFLYGTKYINRDSVLEENEIKLPIYEWDTAKYEILL